MSSEHGGQDHQSSLEINSTEHGYTNTSCRTSKMIFAYVGMHHPAGKMLSSHALFPE
jgi:hypothetical protein